MEEVLLCVVSKIHLDHFHLVFHSYFILLWNIWWTFDFIILSFHQRRCFKLVFFEYWFLLGLHIWHGFCNRLSFGEVNVRKIYKFWLLDVMEVIFNVCLVWQIINKLIRYFFLCRIALFWQFNINWRGFLVDFNGELVLTHLNRVI